MKRTPPAPAARSRKRPATSSTKTTEPTKRYSAVIRVSRRNAREGDAFMSPEQQKKAIRDWAGSRGYELVGPAGSAEPFHDETDSISGKTTDREGLRAAMAQALTGETDGVIVAKVDRFSRSLIEGMLAVHKLTEEGKGFVAVTDGIDSGQGGKSQRLLLVLLLMFAEWHLESLTEGWVSARERHIGRGVANSWPYGYDRVEDKDADNHRRLVPNYESTVVKRIFQRRAAGLSWSAIADELNADGIAPPAPRPPLKADGEPKPRAKRWTYNRTQAIVQNRVYLGELRSGRDIVNPVAHRPLVTADLWEKANSVHKTAQYRPEAGRAGQAHPKRARQSYLLAGIARCASCGGRMVGLTHKVKPTQSHDGYDVRYYRCRRSFSWGTCTRPTQVKTAELDELVLEAFEERWVRPAKGTVTQVASVEVAEAEADLRAAQADLRMFINSDSMAEVARGLGEQWFEEGVASRHAAVQAADEAYQQARANVVGAAFPKDFAKKWPAMDTETKRGCIAQVVEVVAVKPPSTKNGRVPAAERSKMWWRGMAGVPTNLPGRGGSAQMKAIKF
jgi:site-specific DNA recombinase